MSGDPGERLDDLLEAGLGGHPAIVTAETGEIQSYEGLRASVAVLAGRLAEVGARRGSRIALIVPDGPDFLQLLFAAASLGAIAAPLNPAYKRDEYAFYLDDLRPDLLLLPAGELEAAREAAGDEVSLVEVISADSQEPPRLAGRAVEGGAPRDPAGPDDVALLLHTSGTTSRPKQVPLRQRNLTASARSIAAFYSLGPADVSYCAMPLFHVHGLVASTFGALAAGGTVVVPRRFSPRAFWPQLRRHRVTWFSAGPTLHQMILDRNDGDGAPESLRFARSCSSALAPALMARAEATLGVPIVEAYGMTEASHQMASNPLPPAERKPGSVGVPSGAEIRIVDGEGRVLEQGASGEVAIRGPGVTDGYHANPEANADAFFDGWFRTGDRGALDEDGYLRLQGRLKEMILRGGENISPYEIEEVLLAHPAVADAICFGIDDEKYGERVGAAVSLRAPGRGTRADRLLPRAAGRLQGAGGRPHPGRDSPDSDREGAAKTRGCSALCAAGVKIAILGAGAIGAYVGRRSFAGRQRGDADRPRPAPPGDAGARRGGAKPARGLPRPPRRDRRPRRDRGGRGRVHRAEGAQPARARPQDRRHDPARRRGDRSSERAPVVVLPVPPGPARGCRARVGRPRGHGHRLDPARVGDRLRDLLLDGDRRARGHPAHRGDEVRDRRARRLDQRPL